jgi:peptidase E
VFAWARASFDRGYQKRKLLFDYFRSLGAQTVDFVSYSSTPAEIKAYINKSNLIYLTGGVPSVLLERLRTLRIGELLAEFSGVVVGRSAGALALCNRCVVTGSKSGVVKVIEGLGLVNVTLKAHYKPSNDEALLALSRGEPIYAVPKDSALISERGCLTPLHKVFFIQDGQKQLFGC